MPTKLEHDAIIAIRAGVLLSLQALHDIGGLEQSEGIPDEMRERIERFKELQTKRMEMMRHSLAQLEAELDGPLMTVTE